MQAMNVRTLQRGDDRGSCYRLLSEPVKLMTKTVHVMDVDECRWEDDGGPSVTIASVALLNATTVRVTLSGSPTGAGKRLRYAYTGVAGQNAGPTTGARGCLRDSAVYSHNAGNWAVHSDDASP